MSFVVVYVKTMMIGFIPLINSEKNLFQHPGRSYICSAEDEIEFENESG
jgi:hypothetical protein